MRELVQDEFAEPVAERALHDEPLVVHRHAGLADCANLVVFVHGLGGRRYGTRPTWGDFPRLLFRELPDVDVGIYEYVSLRGRLKFWRSVDLTVEAEVLAGILRQASTYQRIILIGHSMGGLLCKAAVRFLIDAGEFRHPPHVSGLIMMATPQAGSLRVPRIAGRLTRDGRAIVAHGALVTQLNTFFTTRVVVDGSEPGPDRESLPTWGVLGASDFWVDTLSASLGLPMNRTRRVRGSHTSIVKPATRDADAFRFVLDRVWQLVGRDGTTTAATAAAPELPRRDGVPAVGVVLGRLELRAELASFVADRHQRLFLLAGPPGWGKRTVAAKAFDDHRGSFDDALWIDCTEARDTASAFLGQLHAMVSEQGDSALEGRWHQRDPDSLPAIIQRLMPALNRKRYLIVLHRVERWLGADGSIRDEALRTVLLAVLTRVNAAKVLVTSEVFPRFDPSGVEVPLGAVVERKVGGLDEDAAVHLLRASGLGSADEQLLRRVAAQYGGMPAALRAVADLVVRGHRPLDQVLQSAEVDVAMDDLVNQSLADLPESARHALDCLAVLRRPVGRTDLPRLGDEAADAVPLLAQRFLVEVDLDNDTVRIAPAVRRAVLVAMPADTAARLHRAAARFYARDPRPPRPDDLADAETALEELFHRTEAGELDAASQVLWWAGPALLTWGYADVVDREARRVVTAADPASHARAAFLLGEVADLGGQYDAAAAHFSDSRQAGAEAGLWPIVTLSVYRLGRIASARSRLAEAEELLRECVAECERHAVTDGLAGALLSLGWVERQQGASEEAVERRFEEALARARGVDSQVEASAHRELGYLAWTRFGRQEDAREHLARARVICERHHDVKELGAVHTTLGYLEVQWGDTDAAIDNLWAAVDIARRIGDAHLLASAYDHLGQAWERRGELGGAEDWYDRSLDTQTQIGNPSGRAVTHLHRSRVRRLQGRGAAAAADLDAARRLVVAYGITDLGARVAEEERALG
ncbi:tetratricopeptide repeat protein [Krasilnikovia sp. M28-CT-15]|uniref:tetratricopeptide repeat protein n=1 Tax=Krasilnikovia sp. M28-CT-15 TaxID=3373540 RepID=UPI0038778C62